MIIPCNCCFSDYKLSGALNQRSSCCACMNWYLSSWVLGSTEEDVRYTVPMSRHHPSFSTRWICISHVFLGAVLKMHPIKDCGPRRIFSKACWEKEQVEHRRNLSLQSNSGIKLSMTSIDFHHSACCWTKCRNVAMKLCYVFLVAWKRGFIRFSPWGHRYLALLLPAQDLWPFGGTSNNPWLQWQRVDGGHTTGGFYRFGGKDGGWRWDAPGVGEMDGWDGWVGSKSYEWSC